jgi:3-oxoacyl-[acyl-carrier-protein] synthase III
MFSPSANASMSVRVAGVSTYLPNTVLSNHDLESILGDWSADKIFEKTGIKQRHIAGPDETALDMGVAAAEKLLADYNLAKDEFDFVIFCSQAPDYILPSSACILQDRLGLPKSIGALDINLGCSGYVYGLSLASALISSKLASKVLLVTADTYSKFIHPHDRSVRTLFGDGAAATLVVAATQAEEASTGAFVFGTDGSGAQELIVPSGGSRLPRTVETAIVGQDNFGNCRSQDNLYMNGAAVMNFTLREVPKLFNAVKAKAGTDDENIDFLILHQANRFMLDALVKKMGFPKEKTPYCFENIGNTVSSSVPFVLADLMSKQEIRAGTRAVLLGFGVGLSWAGCFVTF